MAVVSREQNICKRLSSVRALLFFRNVGTSDSHCNSSFQIQIIGLLKGRVGRVPVVLWSPLQKELHDCGAETLDMQIDAVPCQWSPWKAGQLFHCDCHISEHLFLSLFCSFLQIQCLNHPGYSTSLFLTHARLKSWWEMMQSTHPSFSNPNSVLLLKEEVKCLPQREKEYFFRWFSIRNKKRGVGRRKPYCLSAVPGWCHLNPMTPHNRRMVLLEKQIEEQQGAARYPRSHN